MAETRLTDGPRDGGVFWIADGNAFPKLIFVKLRDEAGAECVRWADRKHAEYQHGYALSVDDIYIYYKDGNICLSDGIFQGMRVWADPRLTELFVGRARDGELAVSKNSGGRKYIHRYEKIHGVMTYAPKYERVRIEFDDCAVWEWLHWEMLVVCRGGVRARQLVKVKDLMPGDTVEIGRSEHEVLWTKLDWLYVEDGGQWVTPDGIGQKKPQENVFYKTATYRSK